MKQAQAKTLLILIILSLILMFLDSKKVLDPVKNPIQTVLAPAQYFLYKTKISVRDAFSFITFWKSGEARIKYLELRIAELAEAKNRVAVLEKENRELRAQLGVTALKLKNQIPAVVLGTGRFLEIGVGTDQGAKLGQTVVYRDNLVGKIIKISSQISFVQLPTDPEARIAAKVGVVRGLVKGEFNSAIIISQIAQNEEIRPEDLVLTSGEGGGYWPGLTIGRIVIVKPGQNGIFKEAEVAPLIDYSKLEIVYVNAD